MEKVSCNSLVEAAYAALKGTKLPVNVYPLNALHPDALRLGTGLTQQVTNPFYGLVGRGVLSTPTVARGQLLRPFPQYDNVTEVLGVNSRLHWTPRAGRNAYLVVNYGREDPGWDPHATRWNVALKYHHDFRF